MSYHLLTNAYGPFMRKVLAVDVEETQHWIGCPFRGLLEERRVF